MPPTRKRQSQPPRRTSKRTKNAGSLDSGSGTDGSSSGQSSDGGTLAGGGTLALIPAALGSGAGVLTVPPAFGPAIPTIANNNIGYLKVVISIVPEFNGSSECIEAFTRACERANDSVDPLHKPFFLHMIRAKCTGPVNNYLSGKKDHVDLESFLTDLNKIFGPRDNYNQLIAELATIFQKKNESVKDFGARVSLLLNKLINTINRTYSGDKVLGIVEGARDNARDCFVTGLNNITISDMVTRGKPLNLEDAVSLGLDAEKFVERREILRLNNEPMSVQTTPVAYIQNSNSNQNDKSDKNKKRETRVCFRCSKTGHIQRNCRVKLPNDTNNQKIPNPYHLDNRFNNNAQSGNNKAKNLNENRARSDGAGSSSMKTQKRPSTCVSITNPNQ